MYNRYFLISICIVFSLSSTGAKRQASGQSQHNLGDFCIPGTCASLNSNCKRVGGSAFRCVCKDQYISVNKTHCVKVINASKDSTCAPCIERGGICLDENSDNRMDKCFCQSDSDLCHERTTMTTITTTPTEPIMSMTEPLERDTIGIPATTPLLPSRSVRQGELTLGLYDISQQRVVENGGSVFIGDRLSIVIKYRTAEHNPDRHQIIAENCSIASSVSDNDIRLEKIPLLTNRCPSLDSRLSVRFQRIDPDHIKSTPFQIHKMDTTSIAYLRCSVAICYGRIENCQERLCPEVQRPFAQRRGSMNAANSSLTTTTDYTPFDYIDEDGASVIALRRRKRIYTGGEKTRKQLERLISDLKWSVDQPSKGSYHNDANTGHYEIRQVQQQFTIEQPLHQLMQKPKVPLDSFYARASMTSENGMERSAAIATISLVFIIGISVSLFVVYRACYSDYIQRMYGSASINGFGPGGDSLYAGIRSTPQVCRYDMGRRSEQRFDESVFVTNVEPLGAYRRQY